MTPRAMDPAHPWSTSDAIALARIVESVCTPHGCHVALTGGLLYKEGPRKDCDLVFYRIRQVEKIDLDGLCASLEAVGIRVNRGFGFVLKASFFGHPVDLLFPEEVDGDYTPGA